LSKARRGRSSKSAITQFGVRAVINFGLALAWIVIVSNNRDAENSDRTMTFFVPLLTLIVTLYDRYRTVYEWRVALFQQEGEAL